MYYEDDTDIIKSLCTLQTPYNGHTEDEVVRDYSNKLKQKKKKKHLRQGGCGIPG